MKIIHHNVIEPESKPPVVGEWVKEWHGLYRPRECFIEHKKDYERWFEVDCLLSILQDVKKSTVTMIEIGAGWGEWCLATAGVIRHNLIPTKFKDYFCIGIEAEPTHYKWMQDSFTSQNINGMALHGLLSDTNKPQRFNIGSPSSWYGQSAVFAGMNPLSWLYRLTKPSITVPSFTMDDVIYKYLIRYANLSDSSIIVNMDIQGMEEKVIRSSLKLIEHSSIDYFIIGTHSKRANIQILKMLEPYYVSVIDLLPRSKTYFDGSIIECFDGLQIFVRKGL